jgi:hypothetical protein
MDESHDETRRAEALVAALSLNRGEIDAPTLMRLLGLLEPAVAAAKTD